MLQDHPSIYVVDDDPSIRKALKRLLGAAGYRVSVFDSAEALLEFFPRMEADCCILDIVLPGISGLDLQDRLCSLAQPPGIIVMTAHDNPGWRETARASGAVACLKKPFDQAALLHALQICRESSFPAEQGR